MKKTLSKILIIILIILTLNNFFISNISFAANVGEFTYYDGNNKIFDFLKEALEDVLGKVIGILTIPFKLGALAAGFAINGLTAAVAYSANDGLEW